METAIKKAIEGGYRGNFVFQNPENDMWYWNEEYPVQFALLDPLFWQALGKAEGWENKQHPHWRFDLMREYDDLKNKEGILGERLHPWQAQMIKFTYHLALGKSPDSFFTELLKNKE